MKHPTKPYHKFIGRIDDVLVLANGEKYNPVGSESIINGHPLVRGALIVGMRKTQVALLVEKSENAPASDQEFIDAIWPAIEKANKSAPGHGQLFKGMIIIAKPDKPFPRAGKGTIQRARAVKMYESEIEDFYKAIESSSEAQEDRAPAAGMPVMKVPLESVQKFVQDHMSHILQGREITPTEDFSVLGFDSLQTTELSNNIRSGLRPFLQPKQLEKLNLRFIYENPTAEKLGAAIYELMNSSATNGAEEAGTSQKNLDKVNALIEKYTTNLPVKAPITVKCQGKDLHVVVTGSSGYLGQYIVLRLLQDPKVSKVICFNRSSDAEAKYLSKGGPKLDTSRLEFLQVSFGAPNFGLPTAKYQELVDRTDAVIHNAWKVDFLHSVESYEDVHIRGLSNFVTWSLASPRPVALSFISSIAATHNWPVLHPGLPIPEAVNDDARLPGMGYGQSKYVGERIIDMVARERGISATVLRSGQIAGPVGEEEHGMWNKAEWFPSIMQTSKNLGLVPADLGNSNVVDWVPVDTQAGLIVDAIHSAINHGPLGFAQAFNLVNPAQADYADLVPAIQKGLGNDDPKPVPFKEWIEELKKHDASSTDELAKFTGLKLLDFYDAMVESQGAVGAKYETETLRRESETMANIRPVSAEDMSSWLKMWDF